MNLSSLKPLVLDTQKYNALMEYLDFRIDREGKQLEDVTDPVQIYREQGMIKAYRRLKSLRDEVLASDK